MAYTTGQTGAQVAAALVVAGMNVDTANSAVADLATRADLLNVGVSVGSTGVLVKLTTLGTGAVAPVFSYDASPV